METSFLKIAKQPSNNSVGGSLLSQASQFETEITHTGTSDFGLFQLQPDDNGSTSNSKLHATASSSFNADIIAVHGLGGAAYNTWIHEDGPLWLRDLAPNKLPGARLYTFGYDSGFAFSKGTGTLRDFARNLLESIKLQRYTAEVLICGVSTDHVSADLLLHVVEFSTHRSNLPQHGRNCCETS